MRYSHIRKSDLKVLVALQVLIEEHNITNAAHQMFLSQPAMSRLFDRLQIMFNDELLIRTGKVYQPTRRALHLYAQLEELLPKLEELVCPNEFRPREATELFRIAMTDNVIGFLSPKLIQTTARIAPGIRFQISSWDEEVFQKIETNELDLVLCVQGVPPPLTSEPLFREQFVCLVRKEHPLGKRPLTLQRYLEQQHVVISVAAGLQGLVDQSLNPLGLQRQVKVAVPYFGLLASIVECTDLIATVPKRAGKRLTRISSTRLMPAPIPVKEFGCIQAWHPRYNSDPAHNWLRELIRQISQDENVQ